VKLKPYRERKLAPASRRLSTLVVFNQLDKLVRKEKQVFNYL